MRHLLRAAVVAFVACTATLAAAVDYTWDATLGTTGPQDGAGTWSTSASGTNWWNGTSNIAWPNLSTDTAVFGAGSGAAGTVTVSGGVTTNGLTFNAPGSGTYTLSSGTITLAGTSPTITANVAATIGSVLAGSAGLVKAGAGTLTLSAANTYSGGSQINAGAVVATNSSAFGGGTITIGASGTASLTAPANGITYSNAVSGSGVLILASGAGNNSTIARYTGDLSGFTGTFRITSPNDYVGIDGNYLSGSNARWDVNNGGIGYVASGSGTIVAIGELSGTGRLGSNYNNATTWEVGALATSSTFGGVFVNALTGGGAGGTNLRKVGAGTLTLTGVNLATGSTTIVSGTLAVAGSGVLGNGSYAAGIANAGSLVFATTANQTLSGNVSGAGVLIQQGSGTLTLSASNSYTGGTRITGGAVVASNAVAFGSGTIALGASGTAVMQGLSSGGYSNAVSGSGVLVLASGAGDNTTVSRYSGDLSGFTGTFRITSQGDYVGIDGNYLSGSNARWEVNNAAPGYVASGAGTVVAIGELSGTGRLGSNYNNATTWEVGALSTSSTFGGVFVDKIPGGTAGGTSLRKVGAGTLTLIGSSSNTGSTTVAGGRLEIGSTGRINTTSGITVNGTGAELRYNSATALTAPLTLTRGTLSGTGTINTPVLVATNATLSPGNSPGTQTYSTGTWASGGTYLWEVNNWVTGTAGVNFDQAIFTNGLAITSSTASRFTIAITSLQADNTAGAVPGFNSGLTARSYVIATGSMSGYSPGVFTLGTSGFFAANTVSGSANGGFWLSTNSGSTQLILNYTPSALYTLSATPSASAIYAGGSVTVTGSIANSNADRTGADSMQFSNFSVGQGTLSVTSGSLATGSGTAGTVSVTLNTAGLQTFAPTVTATNVILGTPATQGAVTSGSVSVWNPAGVNAITSPVSITSVRVSGTFGTSGLTITNTAAVNAYTEVLGATATANGLASTSGSVSGLAGGSTSTSLLVGLGGNANTSSVGVKTGTATVSFTSTGGPGTASIASQNVVVTGTVYNPAASSLTSGTAFTLGNVRVSGTFGTQTLGVWNTATAATGFQEGLAASLSATGQATGSGAFANSITGTNNLTFGLGGSANTSTAGVKSGTVTLGFTSTGTTSTGATGLDPLSLGSQAVTVTGTVFNMAAANSIATPVNLGNVYVGGTFGTSALTISNTAPGGSFTEGLNASFGSATGLATNNSGSFTNLAAQTSNTSSLVVGLGGSTNTGAAGVITGTQVITLASSGINSGLSDASLPSQTLSISGTVWNPAAVNSITSPVSLGNVHVGGTFGTSALSIQNTAAVNAYTEVLGASATTSGLASASGVVTGLVGGSTSTALAVGLGGSTNTGAAGVKSGTATVSFTSTGGPGTASIAAQDVAVSGTVWNYAAASIVSGTSVNFGAVLVNTVLSSTLAISNSAPNDGFSEKLDAAFGSPTGLATGAGSFGLLSAGSTSTAMSVSLASGSAGSATGSVPVNFTSNGNGTSGLGTTSLGSQTVYLTGTVLDPAVASFTSGSTTTSLLLNFGTVNQGDTVAPLGFDLWNLVQTAGYTADLAYLGSVSGTGNDPAISTNLSLFNNLASGTFNSWQASFSTTNAGTFSNTYTLEFKSANDNAVFGSDTSQYLTLTVQGSVVVVPEPGAIAIAAAGLAAIAAARRRRRTPAGVNAS